MFKLDVIFFSLRCRIYHERLGNVRILGAFYEFVIPLIYMRMIRVLVILGRGNQFCLIRFALTEENFGSKELIIFDRVTVDLLILG